MRRTAFVLLVTAALALAGCSDDDEPAEPEPPAADTAEERLETTARIGEVVGGDLSKKEQGQLVDRVAEVVDDWIDAAYVGGDYPRTDFDGAFREFTDGAADLAADQPKVMSNAAVGADVEEVAATRREVTVDVLAPKGDPAGATARVTLVMDLAGEKEWTDRVTGRLLLTPAGGGWQVFGFDIERNEVRGR